MYYFMLVQEENKNHFHQSVNLNQNFMFQMDQRTVYCSNSIRVWLLFENTLCGVLSTVILFERVGKGKTHVDIYIHNI